MAPLSSSSLMFQLMVLTCLVVGTLANINQDVDVTWGDGRGKILNNGNLLTLSLDKGSGSGFQSKNEYLFGKVESQIKLVPGNSAGTVTTFYMSSQGSNHDEIDFEFLGNETGQPYTIHTNVFSNGQGNREMQFRLWFDPTADFHTYSILWNPQRIIFLVDDTPLRVFNNMESVGVAYPTKQPMRLYASLWDAEDWATQGGRVKTDWSKAPFTASYRNLNINKAVAGSSLMTQELDSTAQSRMKWVQIAANSAMVSVIGLDSDKVQKLCDAANEEVEEDQRVQIANFLCPGNYAVSGGVKGIEAVEAKAKSFKARMTVRLAVAGAFHTRFMEPAVSRLEAALAATEIRTPKIPVISNVDAQPHADPDTIKKILARQVTSPVQWETTLKTLLNKGLKKSYELGPGKVIAGIMKRIDKAAEIENISA